MNTILKLIWGKYSEEKAHPLLCHMIDVACVAKVLLEQINEATKKVLAEGMGYVDYDDKAFSSFGIFLIALHDIGKASPGFQWKVSTMSFHRFWKSFSAWTRSSPRI